MEASLAGRGLRRRLDPHPRVTAAAKRRQPPRRLPSPATRERDLQEEAVVLFWNQRATDLKKGVRDSRYIFGRGI